MIIVSKSIWYVQSDLKTFEISLRKEEKMNDLV